MTSNWINLHAAFHRFDPASTEQLDLLRRTTGKLFSSEICDFLACCNGGEGFIGEQFLRLYSVEQLLCLNPAYKVDEFMPGFVLIGSNGGGEAYAINARLTPAPVFQIPFIPMTEAYGRLTAPSVSSWYQSFASTPVNTVDCHTPSSPTFQREIHEINPIVFGGSPTDMSNKALVPLDKHAELCVWWNRTFRTVSARK